MEIRYINNRSETPCTGCGEENFTTSYRESDITERMRSAGECFNCAFWFVASEQKHDTVIDGRIYSIGSEPKPGERKSFLGMGGRRFDIEYLDGRKVTTHNLWAGGDIPEKYKDKIPNTAKFVNGAGEHKVGGTTCWNGSNEVG